MKNLHLTIDKSNKLFYYGSETHLGIVTTFRMIWVDIFTIRFTLSWKY